MMPSWLFNRWKRRRSSGDSSIGPLASNSSTLNRPDISGLVAPFCLPHRLNRRTIAVVRIAPQRVDKNTDRAASRAHVLDLATGQPVVDRPPAHANEFARLHDRNCFSFHLALSSRECVSVVEGFG